MARSPPLLNSAPPILPCRDAAVRDAENSIWYAQLANELAWVAGPVKKLSDHPLSGGGDATSCKTTVVSTASLSHLDSERSSLDSSSTKVESTKSTSPSADTSNVSLACDSSGGRVSSLGSPWMSPFTDTPRAGARLSRGKIGSIRKLGMKLRKRVSLRRPRSASLDVGARRDANFHPRPLGQQVLTGGRLAAPNASSRSMSASMSLPYAVRADRSTLEWDCRLE